MGPPSQHSLFVLAFLVAACGGDNTSGTPSDASAQDATIVVDAVIADASTPDANPLATIAPGDPFVLSVGNESGQDEDPAVLGAADGSIYVAWYSNRNGTTLEGREDKEIFISRTVDGIAWSDPVQITNSNEFSFSPALAQDAAGAVHLVWWRVILLPEGCTVNVDCTGTDNRIMYKSSSDGVTWDLADEIEIASGPGDWLPSIVYDQISDRMLVFFSAIVRDASGNSDLSETTTRIYMVTNQGGNWSEPVRVSGVNPDTSHNTYPHVIQRSDGTFLMTWTRYDASASNSVLQVIMEPSTETMFSTSSDGVTWSVPTRLSGGTDAGAIDAFPWLHAGHKGLKHFVTWIAATTGNTTVEMPVDGSFPKDSMPRPELTGYAARVIPTATPNLFFATWVEGDNPTQSLFARFFTK